MLCTQLVRAATSPSAGGWVNARGRRLVDGGMTQQIALQSALTAGATHVLVLMTHRIHDLMRPITAKTIDIERWLINVVYGSALAECYRKRNGSINTTIRSILARSVDGVAIDYIVRPPESVYLNRLCKDAGILRAADMQSRNAVHRYLDVGLNEPGLTT